MFFINKIITCDLTDVRMQMILALQVVFLL